MKILGIFIICCVLSVQLDGTLGKTCHSAVVCRPDECCMTKSSMVGGCRARGCEGCPCLPDNVKSHLGDMYLMSCPCIEGLVCIPEEEIINSEDKSIEYINSTCRKQETRRFSIRKAVLMKLPRFLQIPLAKII